MKNPHDLAHGIPPWTLGDRLRKARTHAGVSREAMAEDIGCTDRTISNYELDQTRVPKLVVNQYALRCRVPIEWLVSGDDGGDGGVRTTGAVTTRYAAVLSLRSAA